MEKTIAQIELEWRTYGNISRLRCALERERNVGRRTLLAKLLNEQRELVTTHYG